MIAPVAFIGLAQSLFPGEFGFSFSCSLSFSVVLAMRDSTILGLTLPRTEHCNYAISLPLRIQTQQ